MKIGGFKLGKAKEKEVPQEETGADVVDELLQGVEQVAPVRPHAPLQELALDAEVTPEAGDTISAEETDAITDETETVKLVEVQPAPSTPAAPPPPEAKKEAFNRDAPPPPMDLNMSIGNIFNNLEDEANPLANLIKVLPDVAATELIDDLKEINEIIKDWQKK
jgi:hypothetical protein